MSGPAGSPEKNFLDHLEELRSRLLISLAAIGAASLISWFFSGRLFNLLSLPLHRFREVPLYFRTPYEAFLTHLFVAGLAGILIASPVLFTELWFFIAPGLYPREKKAALPLILVSSLLFFAGALFGFFVLVPFGLQFFLSFETESLKPLLGVAPYFSFLVGLVLGSGLLFVLPVLVLGLVRVGILNQAKLKRSRKFVIVSIFILAAIFTPPDPVSQLLLALPLWAIFELCLSGAKRFEK